MKRLVCLFTAVSLAFATCQTKQGSQFPRQSQIPGLATPFKLSGLQSVLLLRDYFIDPLLIDSVSGNEAFNFHFDKVKEEVVITAKSDLVPLFPN